LNEREITEIDPGPAMGLRAMLQDPTGDFYFGSNINSKYRISTLNGSSTYLKLPGIDTSSKKQIDPSFICIGADHEGNIWLVQYKGGVWKYDGQTLTHCPVSDGKEAVTLFSIYTDSYGKLWLGSHKNGIFLYDGNVFRRFKPTIGSAN
jgi:ligand-binding sensor domain-containing protein